MGTYLQIALDNIEENVIHKISHSLRQGSVILYPTDTIYGLGCNAADVFAIQRIVEIKQRPEKNPMLVLVDDRTMLETMVQEITPLAEKLLSRFWPGPLTIIFEARSTKLSPALVSHDGGIAIRFPKNDFCLKLMQSCGFPLVSTSANLSGQPILTDRRELRNLFLQRVDLFIDGGDLSGGKPSTVVDSRKGMVKIVREGVISREVLEPILAEYS